MAIVEWDKYALSKLGEITSSKRIFKKEYVEKGVPFYRTKEVKELANGNEIATELFISEERFNEIDEKFGSPKEGDILLTAIGTIGEIYVVKGHHKFYFKDGNVLWLKKFDSIDPYFLRYALIAFIDELQQLSRGSTYNALPINKLKNHEIFVPPILEQKRIVALLDTVFADLEQTRAKTEQNLKNARELFDSYLQQVFSQIGEGCSLRSMSDKSMLLMIDGDRGKNYPKKSEFLTEGYCLFLSTKNVRPNGFLFDQTMFIDEGRDNLLRKGKLERNDVILTTRGTIGNLALYDDGIEFNNIRINSGMLILRPNTEIILPSYLFEIMRSGIVRKQIDEKVSGAAQPQLPVNTLNTFSFPVPSSLEDQKRIVDLIREAEVKINELSRVYTEKLASIDELKKSILQKAFSGELTATAE